MADPNKVSDIRASTGAKVDAAVTGQDSNTVKSGYKSGENTRMQPHSKDADYSRLDRDSKGQPYKRDNR